MKLSKLISTLLIGASAIAIAPAISSCNNNKGQDYSELKTKDSFTITNSDDQKNLSVVAQKHLPSVQSGTITSNAFDDFVKKFYSDQILYWEFVNNLSNIFASGITYQETNHKISDISFTSSDNKESFDLVIKTNEGKKHDPIEIKCTNIKFIVTKDVPLSNVYTHKDGKIYVSYNIPSSEDTPSELSSYLSRTLKNITVIE